MNPPRRPQPRRDPNRKPAPAPAPPADGPAPGQNAPQAAPSAAALRCPRVCSAAWFLSRTVRQATQMCKHVRKLVHAQRDLLPPRSIPSIADAMARVREAIATPGRPGLPDAMTALEETANRWLKPYPHAGLRENIEVLLVALAVAMGIRTFFLQPFKIPTGSMQPTLYGITHENLADRTDVPIPNPLARFLRFWIHGVRYVHVVARADGPVTDATEATRFLLFNLKQSIRIGNKWHTVWFPPENLLARAGIGFRTAPYRKGDDVIRLRVVSGDHLFVDRLTYNFRHPRRGEIVVFQTAGIDPRQVPQNQYYIKRLVGLPGETVSISTNHHVVVNGRPLGVSDPGFENLYGHWNDQRYVGHVHGRPQDPTKPPPLLEHAGQSIRIRPGHYVVMGDNTRNSLDSRYWGDFPQASVIGRSHFVYWPISERFGWGHR